jgi:hypothetical protein
MTLVTTTIAVLGLAWTLVGQNHVTPNAPKMSLEQVEAKAARDLAKEPRPASSTAPERPVRYPSIEFDTLNVELNHTAEETLKCTHRLLQKLGAFSEKF